MSDYTNGVIEAARAALNGQAPTGLTAPRVPWSVSTTAGANNHPEDPMVEAERLQAQSDDDLYRARRRAGAADEEDDLRFRRRNRQLQADMAAEVATPPLWQE